jgi:hypothetical protein
MRHFGELIADTLGWTPYVDCPLGDDIDTAYIIGMYDAPDYDWTLRNTARASRRIIQFCGSDVSALTRPEMLPDAVYLCETEGIQKELAEHGIEAKLLMFPTIVTPDVTPLPEEPVIGFYAGSDGEKYGASMVRFLMEAMPDAKFHVYHLGQYDEATMREVIAGTRVYVRFTRHDGAAASAREYLQAGRRVVATVDLPHVKSVALTDPVGIVRAVRKALKESEPDLDAAAYYAQVNSRNRFFREFQGVLNASD